MSIKKHTGVGGYFSAAHTDKETGKLHGHTWEVVAWFVSEKNANKLKEQLNYALLSFDHSCLPDGMAWGEDIAEYIIDCLPGCVEVTVSRNSERIFAKATRL